MFDKDTLFKAAVAFVLVFGGLMLYRMHPVSAFAADGLDPSWDAAAQRSHDAGQPTIVLFTADWCPYCRMLHANVLTDPDVQREIATHYMFYTVDVTDPSQADNAHAQKFGVSGIPVMIRFDANGIESDRTYYQPANQLLAWLKAGE